MKQFLSLVICLIATATFSAEVEVQTKTETKGRLTTLFYNAHNLFDADHDEGKDDWSYLPTDYPGKKDYCLGLTNQNYQKICLKTDWSEEKLSWKIQQMKKAIEIVSPELPDILGLCEVENEVVVAMLARELGYSRWIVTNGLDRRGIDNAVLIKESRTLKVVDYDGDIEVKSPNLKKPTRNILRVELLVAGQYPLDIYVNHWPSQGSPSSARIAAAESLMNNVRFRKSKAVPSLFMGDFNTVTRDHPHPFHTVLFQGKNPLKDIYDVFMKDSNIDKKIKYSMPLGTYFYIPKMEWNRLDTFFANNELLKGKDLSVDHKSFRILFDKKIARNFTYTDEIDSDKPHFGSTVSGIPWAYNHSSNDKSQLGFSDHFPIKVDLTW